MVLAHFGEENFEEQRKKDKKASYGISLDAEGVVETEEIQVSDFADEVCERLDGEPEKTEHQKMLDAVSEALKKLTERQREVFLLHYKDPKDGGSEMRHRKENGSVGVGLLLLSGQKAVYSRI